MSGLAGVVAEINEKLNDSPELINEDPFGEGWIIKLKVSDAAAYDSLLSPEDYQAKLSL